MDLDGFDFNDVFVFDLANNHQGSVSHALAIIRGTGEVVRKHGVRGLFKFQFRDMESLIHPSHQSGSNNKHIPRFLSTRLSPDDYQVLLEAVREEGMMGICTPFDEPSVELISRMNFDVIKVASCSAKDWPLLEKVAETGLPVIVSTGGLRLSNVDSLVSFFDHRGCDFAVMHCVSLYPIPPKNFISIRSTSYGIGIGDASSGGLRTRIQTPRSPSRLPWRRVHGCSSATLESRRRRSA